MTYKVILKANNIEELRDILGLLFSNECEHYLFDIVKESKTK